MATILNHLLLRLTKKTVCTKIQ
ncbi:hypothetical protein Gotur_002169 [Gossypium turneri]